MKVEAESLMELQRKEEIALLRVGSIEEISNPFKTLRQISPIDAKKLVPQTFKIYFPT